MADEESVRVAVRVRPFNKREKERNAKLIIKMNGPSTTIINPENDEPRTFSFDFSYWSHDNFKEESNGILSAVTPKYASQRSVFDDLGKGVLDNAFEGYNCSLFAYGQTGSGKSFSMVGYPPNVGIVPITCDELFKTIEGNTDTTKTFEVSFSMLEIYNEQVRDLLVKSSPKGGLSVRQHPDKGFYVENLKKIPVGSYKEIEGRMEEGTKNRTVASTAMNATSSRAHTVVTITFDQIFKQEDGSSMRKSSTMNLVDLAGSERADSTGATGDRLKEGANINKSLSALGNVISALADLSTGKGKGKIVPYRDSVLTKLLQNALGGNSKTIMIAALSPADINYDETLSTLRYADRAKQIKNKAVVNESPQDKLIRSLKEENERLRAKLGGGDIDLSAGEGMSEEDKQKLREELEEQIRAELLANEKTAARMEGTETWEDQLREAQSDVKVDENDKLKKSTPHFINLNADALLSGKVIHFLQKDETSVGRYGDDQEDDISLTGLSIKKDHCLLKKDGKVVILEPQEGANIKVNGDTLTGPIDLKHLDRVLFGLNHLYVFYNPLDAKSRPGSPSSIDYDFAELELSKEQGMAIDAANLNEEQQRLRQELSELYPMIQEVNAISEELNKYKSFEAVLVADSALGKQTQGATVYVKMTNLLNNNTWLWDRSKFINRKFIMEEDYQKYSEGNDSVLNKPKDDDPFWEPVEDVLIGVATVFLQPLTFCIDADEAVPIYDYKGKSEGKLMVEIQPCDAKGKYNQDDFVEDPDTLLNKPFYFKIRVVSGEITKSRFIKGTQVKYKIRGDEQMYTAGKFASSLSPKYDDTRMVSFEKLNADEMEYLKTGSIRFYVYGKQEDIKADESKRHMNTKQLREADLKKSGGINNSAAALMSVLSGDDKKLANELKMMQKKVDTMEGREKKIRNLADAFSEKEPNPENYQALLKELSEVMKVESDLRAKITAIALLNASTEKDDGRLASLEETISQQQLQITDLSKTNTQLSEENAKLKERTECSADELIEAYKKEIGNKDTEIQHMRSQVRLHDMSNDFILSNM